MEKTIEKLKDYRLGCDLSDLKMEMQIKQFDLERKEDHQYEAEQEEKGYGDNE